jgi:hypothetical protein
MAVPENAAPSWAVGSDQLLALGVSGFSKVSVRTASGATRRTTASTYWLMTRAKSGTLSREPMPTSLPPWKTLAPPSWAIAASKLARVRRLGSMKTMASTLASVRKMIFQPISPYESW